MLTGPHKACKPRETDGFFTRLKNKSLQDCTTQNKKNHRFKRHNITHIIIINQQISMNATKKCGEPILHYTLRQTDVFVLLGEDMPHKHNFWTEASNLKHPRWNQQLQAPHFETKDETSRCICKRIYSRGVQHCH
jgi:hypothetical protein